MTSGCQVAVDGVLDDNTWWRHKLPIWRLLLYQICKAKHSWWINSLQTTEHWCHLNLIASQIAGNATAFQQHIDDSITENIKAWWRHQMETFSALLALCAGNSPVPVNSPHKGQWRGALMFPFICAWIHDWVNNHEAGDLRCYRGHYDVSVMDPSYWSFAGGKPLVIGGFLSHG